MGQKEFHYEVFRRQGARGGWVLHDVCPQRDKALKMASELMAEEKATGVKVVKETYDAETGDYLSLKIFEDGHTKMKVEPNAEDVPHALPCFKPDDLYSYHARATLARLLRDFLARNRLTVSELIHRADALEMLEATGTTFQHAVQKIAVAQAASTTAPVQQIIKNLNELSTKAINRVYRDARRNYFPVVAPGGFGLLADKLAGESDGTYVFNGALALHLASAKTWSDKILALLSVMQQAPEEGAGRTLLLASIDTVIADILGGSAALHELIGTSENLGDALSVLVDLFLGQSPDGNDRQGLAALAEQFAKDGLPNAHTAVANRIIAELKSTRKLCATSLIDEIKLLRKIANRLVLGDGRYMSHEELIAAFTLRSRRLVANDLLNEHLSSLAQDAKIERILEIEENIIGVENKRQLGAVLQQILTSPAFEQHVMTGTQPVLVRLKRLAELQARVRRSNFQDAQRREFADALDKTACDLEQRTKVFRALLESMPNAVERTMAVLKLCIGGILTEGRLAAKARDVILAGVAQPGFLMGYIAHKGPEAPLESEAAINELMQLLGSAGISREAGLKSMAA